MPPRGVKPGSKRARQYEHIKESAKDQGASEDPARGDRRADGQQGARPRRRVAHPLPDLDERHVFLAPRRPSLRGPNGPRAARATSSTKKRST